MGKSAKTFTVDIKVLAWLAEYAEKENKKESHIVNNLLNSMKRRFETWTCAKCGGTNHNDNASCYANPDCEGVKA